ncbi:GTA-gp10 family protein [Sphingoaurantiacus capsulatus]|uniref:GTA-gp10 family protein n=1 Tax=Sphingoaurantiacus capsulatus TaxID=1771310 RepID=A0ABV7X538_9SPHN
MAQTFIDLPFADGTYSFRLGLAQINELQVKCGVGIGGLYARLLRGRYVVDTLSLGLTTEAEFHLADVIEPIRQGLIGGRRGEVDGAAVEVSSIVAGRLVENYVCGRDGELRVPLREAWNLAVAILGSLIEGYTPKKAEPAPAPASEAGTETSAPASEAGPTSAATDGSTMPERLPTA